MMSIAQLNRRELVLFDLDGTLVDSAADLYRSMNLALKQLGRPSVSEMQVRTWIGRGASQLCECVLQHQEGEVQSKQHQQLLTTFLDVYQQNLCVESRLYAGVVEFLNACQSQHKKMAIVTNKPYQATLELVQHLEIASYFDYIIGGDSLPQRKPSPEPILHVLQHFGFSAPQALMIGDSRNDVESARAAQVDCIMLSYGYNHGEDIYACQPQQVIDNLMDLLPDV